MNAMDVVAQVTSNFPPEKQVQTAVGSVETPASRFSDLLSAGITQPNPISAASNGVQPAIPLGKATLGDAILGKLGAVGDNYRASVQEAVSAFSVPTEKLGLSGLLRIQMSMAQVSLDIELISKGISKAAQHIDSLTKLQ